MPLALILPFLPVSERLFLVPFALLIEGTTGTAQLLVSDILAPLTHHIADGYDDASRNNYTYYNILQCHSQAFSFVVGFIVPASTDGSRSEGAE